MFQRTRWLVLAVVLCFGVRHSCSAAPLTIVEAGKARAVIVVEPDEPKAMKAGQALQTYIEKMSGTRLSLVQEGEAVEGDPVRLLIGHTQAARELGVEIPAGYDRTMRPEIFEEEGYALKTVGRSIVIGGNNDGHYKGTLYAAYALLERLGCRWYFPDDWGEVVPKKKTISVPDLDVVSRPDFAVRSINPAGWTRCRATSDHFIGSGARKTASTSIGSIRRWATDTSAFWPRPKSTSRPTPSFLR